MSTILNDDVLHEIVAGCSASSLTNLCCVSTKLYAIALPHLLRDATFIAKPAKSLRQFLDFISDNSTSGRPDKISHASPGSRFRVLAPGKHVFYFKVGKEPWENQIDYEEHETHARALIVTEALASMPNLRSVSIRSFDAICRHFPKVSTILLRKPLLVDLELGDIEYSASQSLTGALRSVGNMDLKLKQISLINVFHTLDGVRSLLLACKDTLETLQCCRSHLRELLVGTSADSNVFPKVHTLSLNVSVFHPQDIASSLPSLQTLKLDARVIITQRDRRSSLPNLVSISVHGFRHLSNLLGCIDPPPHLRRLTFFSAWNAENSALATSSLVRQSIKVLTNLTWEIVVGDLVNLDTEMFTDLLGSLPFLTYLSVTMDLFADYQLDILSKQTPQMFNCASLEYLSVSFRGKTPSLVANIDLDLDALALSYAQNIKLLKYLDICKACQTHDDEQPKQPRPWWKIIRGESSSDERGGLELKALKEWEGLALRDRYDHAGF